jgi:hypothetical protein
MLRFPRSPLGQIGAACGGFFGLALVSAAIGSLGESTAISLITGLIALLAALLLMAASALVVGHLLRVVINARRRKRARRLASMPGAVPYTFNAPPGWPVPAPGWLPAPGWEPDPSWPKLPNGWQLWIRTQPRPRHLPRSAWDPHPSGVRTLDGFDSQAAHAALATRNGRTRLMIEVLQSQLIGVEQRIAFDDEYRADPGGRTGRSRWHPAEWAYRHAAQALAMTGVSVGDRLGAVDDVPNDPDASLPAIDAGDPSPKDLAAQDVLSPEDKREIVELLRSLAAWTDELVDAAHERVSSALGASALTSGTGPAASVSWQQAEHVAAAALRQFGFTDADVTPSGADAGLDVSGRTVAAQVKYTGAQVGRPLIQQLAGASGGRQTAFFSRSGYTQHAAREAERLGMALFTVTLPDSVAAYNGVARRLAKQA